MLRMILHRQSLHTRLVNYSHLHLQTRASLFLLVATTLACTSLATAPGLTLWWGLVTDLHLGMSRPFELRNKLRVRHVGQATDPSRQWLHVPKFIEAVQRRAISASQQRENWKVREILELEFCVDAAA